VQDHSCRLLQDPARVSVCPGVSCPASEFGVRRRTSISEGPSPGPGPGVDVAAQASRPRGRSALRAQGWVQCGVGITCSNTDGALRTCHSRVQHSTLAREQARRAGVLDVMAEVFGAFTRALRDADLEQKCEEYLRSQASWPAETGDRARPADRHSPV
jgi:hypothetical protein